MFPMLKLEIYYNDVAQFKLLNVSRKSYEIKVFYYSDIDTFNEIPIHDTNLTLKMHTTACNYFEYENKRFIQVIKTGQIVFELLYPHPTEANQYITFQKEYSIFQKTDYPKLSFEIYKDDQQQLKYLDKEHFPYEVKPFFNFSITEKIQLSTADANLTINVFDDNAYIKIENNKFMLYGTANGTCKINMYYDYAGDTYFKSDHILIYEKFFRNVYIDHFFCQFDKNNIQSNTKMRIFFDTLMEFLDILYAYLEDIKQINNLIKIKDRFLALMSMAYGLPKNDLYSERKLEYEYNKLYRELLVNLLDLLRLRGTKISYELFFGALGYDIELLEYWFDENGNLIEMNASDELQSTFYAYNALGAPLEDIQYGRPDPRRLVNANNDYDYCNKSKYVRAVITPSDNVYNPLAYTAEQQILIREYLNFLKPAHIEYLYEVFRNNLGEENLNNLIEDEDDVFGIYNFNILCGDYIDMQDVQTEMIPLAEPPTNLKNLPYWVPPVAIPENLEYFYKGFWDWQARGMCIEHFRMLTENFIVGTVIDIFDILDIPIKYDSVYKYDDANTESIGIKYDRGVLFYEELNTINIGLFRNRYQVLRNTYSETQSILILMDEYNTTETICKSLLNGS